MNENRTEAELILESIQGNQAALTTLLRQSRRRLLEYIGGKVPPILRGVVDPEDLVQEAHAAVFRKVTTFVPRGEDSFFRWVATIALRKLRDANRAFRAQKRGGGRAAVSVPAGVEDSIFAFFNQVVSPTKTPSRVVSREEAVGIVLGELDRLPESQRRAVWSVYIEGQAVESAASQLGVTPPAIRGLCRRGLERLRSCLGTPSHFLSTSG
ncbi:MAG: sigma-70 family RNA polymerase sigma factor [Planctomycetota bacterium]